MGSPISDDNWDGSWDDAWDDCWATEGYPDEPEVSSDEPAVFTEEVGAFDSENARTSESNGGKRTFHGIDSCQASSIMANRLLYSALPDLSNSEINIGSQCYAVLWQAMQYGDEWKRLQYGEPISLYRFRFAEVCDSLFNSDNYLGVARVGTTRPLSAACVPADSLGVSIYDKDGMPLASIDSSDWAACSIRRHIGDIADTALLFCGYGGWYGWHFLYLAASWRSSKSKRGARMFSTYGRGAVSRYYAKVTAPESLSDLAAGQQFEASLVQHFGGTFGLSRHGFDYEFGDLPQEFTEPYQKLAETGYRMVVQCFNYAQAWNGSNIEPLVEISGLTPSTAYLLAAIRRESKLDVTPGWHYEKLTIPRVSSPYPFPFDSVKVEYVATPLEGRKNPLIKLLVNGTAVETFRYRERRRYDAVLDRVGMKSIWARLHYSENDQPFLYVVWTGPNGLSGEYSDTVLEHR